MSQCAIDANGNKRWRNAAGQLHREDGPAVERSDGSRAWYRNGQCHREDGPAVEHVNGSKQWHRNGQCHREDGPAIEEADGTWEWWIAGLKIAQAQLATLPRDTEGRLHSDTGPLVETKDGRRWFWHGEHVTEMAFEAHCTAQRVMQGLGNVMESQAPQRHRSRIRGTV